MMAIAGECLLTIGRIIAVSEGKDNGGRGRGGTGKAVVDERLREPVEVWTVHAGLQPREGRGTGQVLGGLQRPPFHAECTEGIVPEAMGIIAVGRPGSHLVDTLGAEVTERISDIRQRPRVPHGSSKTCGEANLAVDATQQEGAKISRQGSACEISPYRIPSHGRTTELFWRRIRQKQTSGDLYRIGGHHTRVYQRLARGWCCFVKNAG
jgi:hypothetical protein